MDFVQTLQKANLQWNSAFLADEFEIDSECPKKKT